MPTDEHFPQSAEQLHMREKSPGFLEFRTPSATGITDPFVPVSVISDGETRRPYTAFRAGGIRRYDNYDECGEDSVEILAEATTTLETGLLNPDKALLVAQRIAELTFLVSETQLPS